MKAKRVLLKSFVTLGLLTSCAEKNMEVGELGTIVEKGEITNEFIELAEKEVLQEVQSRYTYDKDWERFKEAVINKDLQGIGAFAGSDAIDAQIIIDLFSDSDFLNQLKAAAYEDLKVNTEGEEVVLEFSATVSGVDEDGNEYESGVYLYFSQAESLLLDYVLAAG